MAVTRKRARAARVGLVAAIAGALTTAVAVFALPAAANPPDPTRPDIELTVDASIDRPFTWEIEKTADVDELTLQKGQTGTVNYSVTVTPTEGTTRWSAVGEIIVYNKELDAVTVNSVTNVISGVGPATLVCPGSTFPRLLGSGAQLRCRFTAELPDNSNRISTATASIGASEFTVSAPVDFSGAIDNRIDTCVAVYDSMVGLLDEQTCVNKANKTVTYSRELGPYADCGKRTVSNTAWAITNHTATRVEDSLDVKVEVPCPPPPDECKDRDKDKDKYGKYGKYGGHDRDECDDDDRCDKRDKGHDWWDWWNKDKCDRDDDRCDRDGKDGRHDKDKYDKGDKCDRDDDDRCDKYDNDGRHDWWDKDKCDRDDDDRCDRGDKDRGYGSHDKDKYGKDDRCDRDDDRDRHDRDKDKDKDRDRDKDHDKDDRDKWGRH